MKGNTRSLDHGHMICDVVSLMSDVRGCTPTGSGASMLPYCQATGAIR